MTQLVWPVPEQQARFKRLDQAFSWYHGSDLDQNGTGFWRHTPKTRKARFDSESAIADRHRVHVPVAAEVAETAAAFLFGAGVRWDDEEAELLADDIGLTEVLVPAASRGSGLGETWFRLGWHEGAVYVEDIDPRNVAPTWRAGRLRSAQVYNPLPTHDGRDWAHVETHSAGVVEHRLYQVGTMSVGTTGVSTSVLTGPLPLVNHPSTFGWAGPELDDTGALKLDGSGAPVPSNAEVGYTELPESMDDRMLLVGVINAMPRDFRVGGRADTEGSESLMAAVDEAISALMRDVRLGKVRLIVSETALDQAPTLGKSTLTGLAFDASAEVFSPLGTGQSMGENTPIVAVQPDIRSNEHLDVARDLTRRIIALAGYDPESVVSHRTTLPESAAARRLRESTSLRTTAAKAQRWVPVLEELVSSAGHLRAFLGTGDSVGEPTAELQPVVSPDRAEIARGVALQRQSGVMSREQAVRELHQAWDDAEVLAEVEKIASEGSMVLGGF